MTTGKVTCLRGCLSMPSGPSLSFEVGPAVPRSWSGRTAPKLSPEGRAGGGCGARRTAGFPSAFISLLQVGARWPEQRREKTRCPPAPGRATSGLPGARLSWLHPPTSPGGTRSPGTTLLQTATPGKLASQVPVLGQAWVSSSWVHQPQAGGSSCLLTLTTEPDNPLAEPRCHEQRLPRTGRTN